MFGEPVNLAAKLEKHTKRESVRAIATAATFVLAEAQGYRPASRRELRRARPVEGVETPLDLVLFA